MISRLKAWPWAVFAMIIGFQPQGLSALPLRHSSMNWIHSVNGTLLGSPVTLVTALMDIGRDRKEYKEWMEITLKIRTPMVVYMDSEENRQWVVARRMGVPTVVIVCPVNEMPYYHYGDVFKYLKQTPDYPKLIDPGEKRDIVFHLPLYGAVQFSKFVWLDTVARHNPFNSSFFFWVDAGIGRWISSAENQHWPNMTTLFRKIPRFAQGVPTFVAQKSLSKALPTREEFNVSYVMRRVQSMVCGGVMGGDAIAISQVQKHAHRFWAEMLEIGIFNNEQIFLAVDWFRHPELYHFMDWYCPPEGCPQHMSDNFMSLLYQLS